MGAMACNRNGCTHVMCTRYSCIHGYICDHCFDELVHLGTHTDIEEFMNKPKKIDTTANADYAYLFFDNEFPG